MFYLSLTFPRVLPQYSNSGWRNSRYFFFCSVKGPSGDPDSCDTSAAVTSQPEYYARSLLGDCNEALEAGPPIPSVRRGVTLSGRWARWSRSRLDASKQPRRGAGRDARACPARRPALTDGLPLGFTGRYPQNKLAWRTKQDLSSIKPSAGFDPWFSKHPWASSLITKPILH